jgi:hypothetical protein
MEPDSPLERELRFEERATDCIVEHLSETKDEGRLVFSIVDVAEATSLSPSTVEAVMSTLEREGPFDVRRQGIRDEPPRWVVLGAGPDRDRSTLTLETG